MKSDHWPRSSCVDGLIVALGDVNQEKLFSWMSKSEAAMLL